MVLSAIIFLPLLGAVLLVLVPPRDERTVRRTALFASLTTFVLSLLLLWLFNPGNGAFQLEEKHHWFTLGGLAIHYHLAIDGLSLWMVLLTTFLTPLALLCSWKYVTRRVWEFSLAMLLLETGMLGVFCAADMWLFYIFWEAALIPMYLLIGVWGHENRVYAAMKFILYTAAGSLLMFVGIIYLHLQAAAAGAPDFSVGTLPAMLPESVSPLAAGWLFAAFALAFAIKVPMVPLHTWLPRAHVEAPTPGSVLLAAVLLKMGVYGFLRFAIPLFPEAAREFAPYGAALAVAAIIYGALLALAQRDLKTLIAYSSVSHLGYAMLGLFAMNHAGVTGCIFVMVAHGLASAGLFVLAGMLYERRHTRQIAAFGGLAGPMPRTAVLFTLIALSAVGLPATAGFVGEFSALYGAFLWNPTLAAIGALGIVLGAVYMLWTVQRVFYGKIERDENRDLPDATPREMTVLIPLVVMIFVLGLVPKFLTSRTDAAVKVFVERAAHRRPTAPRRAGPLRSLDRVPRPAEHREAGAGGDR